MRIVPVAHSNHQVQFTSAAGEAVTEWRGDGLPVLGEPIDVELDIADRLHWDEIEVVHAEPGLFRAPEPVARARVVAVDDDGVLTLSVGGAIVLLETYGPPPDVRAGMVVEFEAARLGVFPTGI